MTDSVGPFSPRSMGIGSWLLATIVVCLILLAGLTLVDRSFSRTEGITSGTVVMFDESASRYSTIYTTYVDVGEEGSVAASNPLRLTTAPGMQVELSERVGSLTGSTYYSVVRVLPTSSASDSTAKATAPKRPADTVTGNDSLELRIVGVLLALLSLWCAFRLWTSRDRTLGHKIAWTPVLALPLFGPIFYYTLRPPPPGGRPAHLHANPTVPIDPGAI